MSIDFPCSNCHQTVRVPDGTEGKKTKCPKCQQVQVIPDKNSFGSAPPPAPTPPPQPPPKSESMWDDLTPEPKPAAASSSNPFGDAPDPFGPPATNPYSSPAQSSYSPRPASRAEARSKLMGPAIGVLLCNGLGLLLLAVWAIATIIELQGGGELKDTPEIVGASIALFIMFGLPFLLSLLCIAAMIRAFAVRNYALVMTGFILSITPFGGGCACLIGMLFGIWGIVMMNDDSVKAAFRQP
ncbi:hypothetical protein Pan97_03800 [Bremerella volcania]|uniref:Uncharacterized protein n=1 Tax=Bremerella volcania TaxID=2527984 RepID=A0A518C2F8_9BACT|nr:hypothetical protein [Bremerella volcania]QDU73409.1 hypothetical protein Pan97_03800 [Bremerella volcania]